MGYAPRQAGGEVVENAIASYSGAEAVNASSDYRGWRFLVGDAPLTVNAVRTSRGGSAFQDDVSIWRVSDGARVVGPVEGVPAGFRQFGEWVEVSPVALEANTEYIINYYKPIGNSVWRS